MTTPIDLYFWPSPNGWKIAIMLEECALPYRLTLIDPGCGHKLFESTLRISPSGRVPAILDRDGPNGTPVSLWDSAAILQYLGDKAAAFYPPEQSARPAIDRWLFWQDAIPASERGPSQAGRHNGAAGAVKRYAQNVRHCFGVLDKQLGDNEYVAGSYSIADIALWPWIRSRVERQSDLGTFHHVMRWFWQVGNRSAVKTGAGIGRGKAVGGRTVHIAGRPSWRPDPVTRRIVQEESINAK